MPDLTVTTTTQSLTLSTAPVTVDKAYNFVYSGTDFDPSESSRMFSEFLGSASPFSFSTGTTANPSSGSYLFENSTAAHGFVVLSVNGTQNSRIGVFASAASTSDVSRTTYIGYGAWTFKARAYIQQATQQQRCIVGVGVSHAGVDNSNDQTLMLQHGIAFVSYGSTGTWIATLADNNQLTEIATDVPVTANGFTTFEIILSADGLDLTMKINDSVVYESSDGPFFDYANGVAWGIEMRDKKSGGSNTAGIVNVDYMDLNYTKTRMP